MIIKPSLVNEIETKRRNLDNNPEFYLALNRQAKTNLDSYSRTYSWWIEHPDIRCRMLNEKLNGKEKGKLISVAREGVKRLYDGWEYLSGIDDPLDKNVLIDLSKIIEPSENDGRGFRKERVTLGFDGYTPPNPIRVEQRLEEAFYDLRRSGYSTVEKAAKAHLFIAGIQPFMNGNKRLARLIQDKILRNGGLPTAIIPVGEREIYLDLLETGLRGIRDYQQMSDCLTKGLPFEKREEVELRRRKAFGNQVPFCHYIAGKVNTSLDHILRDIFVNEPCNVQTKTRMKQAMRNIYKENIRAARIS